MFLPVNKQSYSKNTPLTHTLLGAPAVPYANWLDTKDQKLVLFTDFKSSCGFHHLMLACFCILGLPTGGQ